MNHSISWLWTSLHTRGPTDPHRMASVKVKWAVGNSKFVHATIWLVPQLTWRGVCNPSRSFMKTRSTAGLHIHVATAELDEDGMTLSLNKHGTSQRSAIQLNHWTLTVGLSYIEARRAWALKSEKKLKMRECQTKACKQSGLPSSNKGLHENCQKTFSEFPFLGWTRFD